MTTYFISDLHLEAEKPELVDILIRFLQTTARDAKALYLLGDVFEVWIGDDGASPLARRVAAETKALAESGVEVYFMHGNRDFLVGEAYALAAGITLLPDPCTRVMGGVPTLLSHGDAWCTDDEAYMRFRQKSRSPDWQRKILSTPVLFRRALSAYARWKSRRHNRANIAMAIGDVVQAEVEEAFRTSGVARIIHGHTHRPAVHGPAGRERIVLADWRERGEALALEADGSYRRVPLE